MSRNLPDKVWEIYSKADQYRDAIPYKFDVAYPYLLKVSKEQGRTDRVIEISEKVLSLPHIYLVEWDTVGIELAQIYMADGNLSDARRVCQTVLTSRPESRPAREILQVIKRIEDEKQDKLTNKSISGENTSSGEGD
ncbi:hypothetical protein KAW55_06200 [bacterium]|nr:hypothetical protein [bacterium]